MISASAPINSLGQSGSVLLVARTAASLSHQWITSSGVMPRYSMCLSRRNVPSSSARYDERELMLDTTNTAAVICLVSSAMSHPADMTFSSRNRDPSLASLIFDAVVRMLEWRIFPGCGTGSTELCLGGLCFLAVHILSPSTKWQSTGWASRGMPSTRPVNRKRPLLADSWKHERVSVSIG